MGEFGADAAVVKKGKDAGDEGRYGIGRWAACREVAMAPMGNSEIAAIAPALVASFAADHGHLSAKVAQVAEHMAEPLSHSPAVRNEWDARRSSERLLHGTLAQPQLSSSGLEVARTHGELRAAVAR